MSYELTPGTNSKYRSPNINRNILQNKSNKNTPYNIQATKTIKTQQMNDNDNNDDPLDQ